MLIEPNLTAASLCILIKTRHVVCLHDYVQLKKQLLRRKQSGNLFVDCHWGDTFSPSVLPGSFNQVVLRTWCVFGVRWNDHE